MHKTKQLTEKPSKLKRIFSPGYPCVNSTLMCNFHNPSPLMPIIWHTDNFTTIWNPSSPILGTIPPAQQPAKGFCLDLWRRIWLTTMGHFLSLTLKLASNQLHAGNADRVLVKNNFDRDFVCHMVIKVFHSIFTTTICKCTVITGVTK